MSKDTILRITDRVLTEMADWQDRPLDRAYPVMFIDALVVKIRDGQVTNVGVWTDLRNAADHGQWDKVDEARPVEMIRGVGRFLAAQLPRP